MKRNTLILTSIICTALWQVAVQGATKYWDIDGATPGAGGPNPSGIWDTGTTANWTTDSTGSSAGTMWSFGDDAVFSAGSDATGAFTVDASSGPTAGNLTTEEGDVTISGALNVGNATAGKGIISVAAGATNTISATISGGDDTGTIRKTGPGTLTLSADNSGTFGGTNVVADGVLIGAASGALGALGASSPIIVSNGASLNISVATTKDLILNGQGFGGAGGAFRITGGTTRGGATYLGSDARINYEAGGTVTWNASTGVDGTTAAGALTVTIGGNGGTYRMNNGFRSFVLNAGSTLNKDGNSVLRFETPTVGITSCNLNGGFLFTRTSGSGDFMGAGSPINVAGTVTSPTGGFITGNFSPNLHLPIALASGANPLFNIVSATTFTENSVISGLGGLSVTNAGKLIFTAANTYSGKTTILGTAGVGGGTLVLTNSGNIGSSQVIEVQQSATFDVSFVTGGYILGSAQTLMGNGGVLGNVTANGTISPGASVGTLTFTNDLTVSKLFIEVDKSLTPSNDVVAVIGALSAVSGTLTVSNLNPGLPLAVGDTFAVFKDDLGNNKAVTGGGSLTVVSAEGGVTWNNNLATDGTISVNSLSVPQPPPTHTRITSISGAGTTSVTVNYTNTIPGTNYTLSYSTNLATPNWYTSGNKVAPGTTDSQIDSPPAGSPRRYYRVYYYRP